MNRFFLPFLCASIGFLSPVWAQAPACCNLLTNGDFEQGYTEFTSGLPQSCACASNSHCVSTNFQSKCGGWDNVPDHTSGSGNFLIIDGSTGGGVDVWRKSTPILANVNYCFSFWVVSQYDEAFDLELTVDGVSVPGSTFPVQQGSPVWTQYSLNFTGMSGSVLAIRQVTGGLFRDFGIDDIEFGAPLMADFAFTPDAGCGMNVSFFNQSTGQSPLTYAWNFDDPSSGAANVSTQQNPTHKFTDCGTYNVCLEVSKGGCTDLICQSIQVEDLVPPTALCAGISLELDANCMGIITPALIDGGSFDNCYVASMSVSPSLITGCGFFPVTLTVTDSCGNSSECTVEVQTSESVPPTLDCPPSLSIQGTLNSQGICTGIMPQLNIGAVDNCGTVTITSVPAQGSVLSAGSTVVAVTGEDECGNTDICSMTITVFCETGVCACPAGGSSGSNLITNGSFTLGDVGFGSLPLGCTCLVNTHCVLPQFTDKCPGWTANFYDHTYGNSPLSQFLVIDGHPTAAADVWTQPINVSAGKTYCFSFWVARVYPTAFNLGVTINGVLVDPSAVFSVNSGAWTQHSITWTNASLNGTFTLAIRQMTGGSERDFGLDDICLREVCEADFTFQNLDNCGKVQFTSTSTGPAPLQYCWDFDGDPTTCESTLPNPMWQFSTCGNYNVCLTISGNGCVTTICQTVVIVDNTPPIANCVGGLSIIMNANCTATLSANDVNLGSSDECPFQLSISQSTFTQCGVYPVVLTVTDWCGNTSTCTAPINVVEMVAPVIGYCPNNVAVVGTIGTNGLCTGYVVPLPTPFASDNCDPLVMLTNNAPPSGFFPAGTTAVLWTATDDCGNTATCSYTINVSCETCACGGGTASQNLVANGNFAQGNIGFTSGLTWDNGTGCAAGRYGIYNNFNAFCGGWGPLAAFSAPNFLNIDGADNGINTMTDLWISNVVLTANTDYCFSFRWASAYANADANFNIEIYIENGAVDEVLGTTQIVQNTIVWTQASHNWNSGAFSGPQVIRIRQVSGDDHRDFGIDDICFTKSAVSCETSITVTQNTDCTVTVTAVTTGPQPVNYQWCDGQSGSSYTTQVLPCVPMTYCVTATCANSSTSTASVVYTATDVIPPVAVCNPSISLDLGSACTFQVTSAFVDGGSSDNCGIMGMSVSPTVLPSCATTTVTLTVKDWCGNTSTCTMGIQTAESIPPVINNCPQNQIVPMDLGMCFYTFIPPVLSITDNCDPNPVLNCTWEDPNGTILPLTGPVQMPKGTNKIRCKAIDNCDNESAPCNYAITVGDYESPTIICPQNLTVYGVITNNICEAVVNNIAPIVTDNCPIQSLDYFISPSGNMGVNDASGETFPQGVSTVAYVVTDCGGFTNACFFTVTVDCSCGPTCLTNSVDISTGHQDQAAAGILVPGHINQNWRLKSAPPGSGLTNFDFPGHMLKHSSWTQFGSTWMSAYLFNDLTTFNGTPGSGGIPFVYERTFCICEDGDVNFNFQFWSDDCGKVELVNGNGALVAVLADNCTTPTTPNNWTTPSLSPTAPYFLTSGAGPYTIRISHWNTTGQPMGVNLSGTITGSNLEKDECCDPQEACFLIRKFENVPNGQPYYEWYTNDWVSYDKPLSGWYFNMSNGTNSYGPFGPSDILGEVLVCNLPVGLPGPFYSTTEVIQPGWTITWSNSQPQTLVDHHVQVMEFGNSKDNGCGCGTLSNLVATPMLVGGHGVPLTCGGPPVNLNWTIGSAINITGKLQCQGTCLPTEWVSFSLATPNGSVYVGGAQTSPYFAIGLLPVWYSTPGLYTLTLQGYCGGSPCTPCVIQFQINNPDPCPCDPADFQADLSQGFATSYATTGCVACFTPIALNDCDIVHWSFNGGAIVGTTFGKQTFCYNLNAGAQNVTMTVVRKDSDGNKCDQGSITQSVNITCGFRVACDASDFGNPGFSEMSDAGGINSTGASAGWYGPCGEPVVVSGEPGSHDGWTIQLTGNLDSADVLAPRDSVCIPLDSGVISLRYGIKERGIKSTLHIQLYQGPEFEMNECNGTDCIELASIDLSPLDTGWHDLELPYDIRDWTAVMGFACTDGVNARVAIFVSTAIGNDQGSYAETSSSIQVDNFCMGDGIVSVKNISDRLPLRIFPNPNPGKFTAELPEAATSGMSFRVIGLTGQVLREQLTQTGLTIQTVETGDLPAGLYFLQVVSDNKVIAIEKFVKQ